MVHGHAFRIITWHPSILEDHSLSATWDAMRSSVRLYYGNIHHYPDVLIWIYPLSSTCYAMRSSVRLYYGNIHHYPDVLIWIYSLSATWDAMRSSVRLYYGNIHHYPDVLIWIYSKIKYVHMNWMEIFRIVIWITF